MSIFSDPEVLNTLRHERAPEPAKRWRNKWRAVLIFNQGYGKCPDCGCDGSKLRHGDVFWSCCAPYPSKDVAETWAQIEDARDVAAGFNPDDYLGAFPVEEGA